MQYFYIQTTEPAVYGSFDTKSEALRYANNAGFTCDWELVITDPRDADVEHDGNSNHTHLD